MKTFLYALIIGCLTHYYPPYRTVVEGIFGLHGYWTPILAAGFAFLAPWMMGRAFMTRQEAERKAAYHNSRPDSYDFDHHHMHRNPQNADPEGIKVQYLISSLLAWLFQAYLVFRTGYPV